MKKTLLYLFAFISLGLHSCNGNNQAQHIIFDTLAANDFNFAADSSFSIPQGEAWNQRRHLHDSCMGFTFPANAMFIRTKDTFRLGTVVNRKTMKVVTQGDLRKFVKRMSIRMFNVITKPCYERIPVTVNVNDFFGRSIAVDMPGATEGENREVNSIIKNSVSNGIEIGAWFTVELPGTVPAILDTTKDAALLAYKTLLLDSNNIILTRAASMTDITFFITTRQPLSRGLKDLLQTKPYARVQKADFGAQLFFIDDNNLQLTFNGLFQVMGQFMRCREE